MKGIILTLYGVLIILGFVFLFFLRPEKRTGYTQELPSVSTITSNEEVLCIQAGGIPLKSIWNGGLRECQFPPKMK